MISFKTTETEQLLIEKAARRAHKLAKKHGVNYPIIDATMDLAAVHLNACMLDLNKLNQADDFNFSHDVFGIRRHLDRTTGQLGGCFSPRCEWHTAASSSVAAE